MGADYTKYQEDADGNTDADADLCAFGQVPIGEFSDLRVRNLIGCVAFFGMTWKESSPMETRVPFVSVPSTFVTLTLLPMPRAVSF